MYADEPLFSRKAKVKAVNVANPSPRMRFVVSHLQFTLVDRYSKYPRWIAEVLKSYLEESATDNSVPAAFDENFRATIHNLYEYCKFQEMDLPYSEFQAIIRQYYDGFVAGLQSE
jgi:hypothetical protein